MTDKTTNNYYGSGIGMGSVIAMLISYLKWKSIWWLILHGILGWAYVVYYLIRYGAMI